jgi:hypothetical protein
MSATSDGSPKPKPGCGVGCTVIFVVVAGIGLLGLIVGIVAWLRYTLSETRTGLQKEHASPGVVETPRPAPTEKARATASEQRKPAKSPATQQGTVVNPSPSESKLEIKVNKETFLQVSLNPTHFPPVFIGVVYPTAQPVVVSGKRFWVQAEDPGVLELWKNGQAVDRSDPDVVVEKY